ncbi:MAG: hypothetical protein E6J20_17160 [Chloroflexi bacterium]|nr:MAG: hypothetical protein E6J20_17160 [Chloroflexota bacterium]
MSGALTGRSEMPGRIGRAGGGVGIGVATGRAAWQQDDGIARGVADGDAGARVRTAGEGVPAARRRASSASSWKNTMLTAMNLPSMSA